MRQQFSPNSLNKITFLKSLSVMQIKIKKLKQKSYQSLMLNYTIMHT